MNDNANKILAGLKEEVGKREIEFIDLQPYRPNVHESRNLLLFVKLLGYHLKWHTEKQVPIIYGPKHRSHGFVQKEGEDFYLIRGDRKYPIELISKKNIPIFEKFVENNGQTMLSRALRRMWGIRALGYA